MEHTLSGTCKVMTQWEIPQPPEENQDVLKSLPWVVDIPWLNDSFRRQESETINRVIEMTLRNLERFKKGSTW